MKDLIRIALLGGLATFASSCGGGSGSGGSGGSMFVESCNLGCNSGSGGAQVSCAFANTPQNAEIALKFSRPVDFGSVNSLSFVVTDTVTGLSAPGNFLPDPIDATRLLFRPLLDFDSNGNPLFGFQSGSTYLIVVKGTAQGDTGAIVRSTGGALNQSRVVCQITADQGIVDTVPGPPNAFVFVRNTAGATVPADGALDISVTSLVTMIFDDIMNVGTLVIPSSGIAPFIRVLVDTDGDLATPADQVELAGTLTFDVDQFALRTTLVFTPSGGLPSAGPNPTSPRQIIVRLPAQITDLSGNNLNNAGDVVFTPEMIPFVPLSITENFLDQNLADLDRTGSDWADSQVGRLKPGVGGGSGRLGDLFVRDGETVVLDTSPAPATGTISMAFGTGNVPTQGDQIILNGVTLTVRTASDPVNFEVGNRPFGSYFVDELVNVIDQIVTMDPASPLAGATYSYATDPTSTDTVHLMMENTVAGTAGNPGGASAFPFDVIPGANSNTIYTLSGPVDILGLHNLDGGADGATFPGVDTVTNTDFQTNPGTTPPDILVTDGVFEFNRLVVEPAGTLLIAGDNPARIFVRGNMDVAGLVNARGMSPLEHVSDAPDGQSGASGGPNGGSGGKGGDRPNNPGGPPNGLQTISTTGIGSAFNRGIDNVGAAILGKSGRGVGQLGVLAGGIGGAAWPRSLPPVTDSFPVSNPPGLETTAGQEEIGFNLATCTSGQVGGAGGGGSYATDGGLGRAMAEFPAADPPGSNSNTPPDTAAGDATPLNIEPPGQPPAVRLLRGNNLRGGSGGGGGGLSLNLTETNGDLFGDPADCTETGPGSPDQIISYYSHSGSGGGGGGGAVQVNVGRDLAISGVLTSAGGNGGSAFTSTDPALYNTRSAAPGGAGAGGTILAQSASLTLPPAGGRMSVAGGQGGRGKDELPSTGGLFMSQGGDGGTGLVRVETLQGLTNADIAAMISPDDSADDIEFLTVGTWTSTASVSEGPATMTAATSCWIRPTGSFFSLNFASDGAGSFGWDVTLNVNFGGGPVSVSYRDPNDPNNPFGMSIQQVWGDLVRSDIMMGQTPAPIAIRFQGAKTTTSLTNPCISDPFDFSAPFALGSVTPWVRHPEELNDFTPSPDAIRFCVIFDRSSPNFPNALEVESVRIDATPE